MKDKESWKNKVEKFNSEIPTVPYLIQVECEVANVETAVGINQVVLNRSSVRVIIRAIRNSRYEWKLTQSFSRLAWFAKCNWNTKYQKQRNPTNNNLIQFILQTFSTSFIINLDKWRIFIFMSTCFKHLSAGRLMNDDFTHIRVHSWEYYSLCNFLTHFHELFGQII